VAWRGTSDTVGGHVTEVLGHLPAPGERASIDGVEIEVEAQTGRAVTSVLARPRRALRDAADG
jgi:Mg2+/Co2+ transporter CorC